MYERASRQDLIERRIARSMDVLRARGYINRWRLVDDYYQHSARLEVLILDGRYVRSYRITETELAQGGLEALDYWLETVERDILLCTGAPENALNRQQAEYEAARQMEQAWAFLQHDYRTTGIPDLMLGRAPDPQAEQRSKDLFLLVAGKEAFETLSANKPLPLTGSEGTAYWLHNRASYCVERVKDGAKLCAVVPNVPLWDHLLGIKLMVENDEPQFLKTANVAQAGGFSGLDFSSIINETIRSRAPQMAANVQANNAMVQRLRQYESPQSNSIIGNDMGFS